MKMLKLLGLVSLLLVPFVISCDVGLGSSVDTQSPEFLINYPPASSVIREDFIVAGTATDDKGINSINLVIKNTTTQEKYSTHADESPLKAFLNTETDQWKIEIKKEDLPKDGKYEFTFTAKDQGGHRTVATTTYEIDNTAPILYLTKPSATGASSAPSSFGKTIKIAGEAKDEHTIERGILYVVKTTNGVLSRTIEIPFDDASTISTDNPLEVAKYYSENEFERKKEGTNEPYYSASELDKMRELKDNYLKIYTDGTTDPYLEDGKTPNPAWTSTGTTQKIYASIRLYDNARVYQNPVYGNERDAGSPDGTGNGNETEEYYINSGNFTKDIITAKGLAPSELMKIFNNNSTKVSVADVKNWLSSYTVKSTKDIEDGTDFSYFSVNPENNPTWNMTGYEYASASNYSMGSTVTLNFNAGTDGDFIRSDSIKIFIAPETRILNPPSGTTLTSKEQSAHDAGIIMLSNVKGQVLPGTNTASVFDGKDDAASLSVTFDPSSIISSYNDAAKVLYPGIRYRIFLNEEDSNSEDSDDYAKDVLDKALETENSGGYGFVVTSNSSAPVVSFNMEEDKYFNAQSATDGILITGVITCNGTELEDYNVSVTVADTAKNNQIPAGYTLPSLWYVKNATSGSSHIGAYTEDPNGDRAYTFSIKAGTEGFVPAAPGRYKYTIKVQGVDNVSRTDYQGAKISFYVDSVAPTLNDISVTPYVTSSSGSAAERQINGKVTVKSVAGDNYKLKKVSYKIGSQNEVSLGNSEDINFVIDTTVLPDNQNITVLLKAEDDVGNIAQKSVTYKVNQSSDKPQFTPTNFNGGIGVNEIQPNKNLFGTSSNNTLLGTISDDDGIKSVKISATNLLTNNVYVILNENFTSSYPATYSLNRVLKDINNVSLPQGKYTLKIETADYLNETGNNSKNEYTYNIGISSGAPEVILNGIESAFRKNATVSGSGYVLCQTGEKPVVTLHKEDGTKLTDITATATSVSGKYNIAFSFADDGTKDEGTQIFKVKAVNNFSEEKETSGSYTIDGVKPTVAISSITPYTSISASQPRYLNGMVKLNISAYDKIGMKKLELFIYRNSMEESNLVKTLSAPSDSLNSWEASFDTKEISSAEDDKVPVIFKVVATDTAGNTEQVLDTTKVYAKGFSVWQGSDKPQISPSNFKLPKTAASADSKDYTYDAVNGIDYSDIKQGKNLFGTNANNVLLGTITDDDGVRKVTVTTTAIDDRGVKTGTPEIQVPVENEDSTSVSLSYVLPYSADSQQGIYEAVFDVEDVNYVNDETTPLNRQVIRYYIGVSSGAPVVVISPIDGVYKDGDKVSITGEISSASLQPPTLVCMDDSDVILNNPDTGNGPVVTRISGSNKYTFTHKISASGIANEARTVQIKVVASNSYNEKTTQTITYKSDNKPPVIPSSPIEYLTKVTDSDGTTLNGIVSFNIKGIRDETELAFVKWEAYAGIKNASDNLDPVTLAGLYGEYIENLSSINVTNFNTVLLAEESGDATIVITARDSAGNVSRAYYTCKIDQRKDKPAVTFTNGSLTGENAKKENIKQGSNNLYTHDQNMMFTVSDDDGVNSMKVTATGENGTEYTIYNSSSLGNLTSVVVPVSFKDIATNAIIPDGVYKITVSVEDSSKATNYCTTKVTDFYAGLSGGVPGLSYENSNAIYGKNFDSGAGIGKILVTGYIHVTDGKKPKVFFYDDSGKNYVSISSVESTPIAAGNPHAGEYKFTYIADCPEEEVYGTKKFKFKAQNMFEQETVSEFQYQLDNEKPTVKISSVDNFLVKKDLSDDLASGARDNVRYVNGTVTVSGTAGDKASEVYSVNLKVKRADSYITELEKTVTRGQLNEDPENWSLTIDTTKISTSDAGEDFVIEVIAKDTANNVCNVVSPAQTYCAWQKTDLPFIKPTGLKNLSQGQAGKENGNFYNDTNNTLTGSVADDDSVKSFKITATYVSGNNTKILFNKTDISGQTSYPYSVKLNESNGAGTEKLDQPGEWKLTFETTDVNGKAGVVKEYYIAYSAGTPNVTVNQIEGARKSGSTFTVSGTIACPNKKLDTANALVIYADSTKTTRLATIPAASLTQVNGSSENYTYSVSITDASNVASGAMGTGSFYAVATDIYGETGNVTTKYTVDNKSPDLSISSISPYVDGANKVRYLNGKVTVSGTANDSSGLASVIAKVYKGSDATGTLIDLNKSSASLASNDCTFAASSGNLNVWSFDFDTTKIVGIDQKDTEENIYLEMIATDVAGNKTVIKSSDLLSAMPNISSYKVLQNTDTPVLKPTNFISGLTAESDIKEGSNLFGVTSNKQINSVITDDDGIASYYVMYRRKGATNYTTVINSETDSNGKFTVAGNPTTYPLTLTLPELITGESPLGVWDLLVKVVDINGETNSINVLDTTTLLAITTGAPEFVSGSLKVDKDSYKSGATVKVTGQVKYTEPGIKPVIEVNGTQVADDSIVENESSRVTDASTKITTYVYDFTQTLTAAVKADDTTDVVAVTVSAANKYSQTVQNSVSYTVDNKKPEVEITSVIPLITKGSDTYVNGKITLSGKSSDTVGLQSVSARVYKKGSADSEFSEVTADGTVTPASITTNMNNWTFTVDTTKVESYGTSTPQVKIVITAADKAGNVKTDESDERIYIVDQKTDIPTVDFSNCDVGKTFAEVTVDGTGKKNIFGKSSNNYLTATIEDDDGIGSIKVWYKKIKDDGSADEDTSWKEIKENGTSVYVKADGGKTLTTYPVRVQLPSAEGKYKIKIDVIDTVNANGFNKTANADTDGNTVIGVSDGAPVISNFTVPTSSYIRSGNKYSVSGKVTSGVTVNVTCAATSTAAGFVTSESAAPTVTWDAVETNKFLCAPAALGSGSGDSAKEVKLTFTAKDIFNQSAVVNTTYTVDNTKPEFVENIDDTYRFEISKKPYSSDPWVSGKDIAVSGYVEETLSGIDSIKYTLTPSGETTALSSDSLPLVKVSGTNYYKFQGTISGFKPGSSNKVIFELTDAAGNSASAKECTIKMDEEAPSVSSAYYSTDGTTLSGDAAGNVTINGEQDVTIYGLIEDTASGISSSTFKLGANALPATAYTLSYSTVKHSTWAEYTGASWQAYGDITDKTAIKAWKAVFKASKTKQGGVLKISGTDLTGVNKYDTQLMTLVVDSAPPVYEVLSPAKRQGINGTGSFSGTAGDTNGLSFMKVYYTTTRPTENEVRYDTKTPDQWTTPWKVLKVSNEEGASDNLTDTAIFNWKFENVDFNAISGATGATETGTVYILPVIIDKAGNSNAYSMKLQTEGTNAGKTEYTWKLGVYEAGSASAQPAGNQVREYKVDRNTDRPHIRVNNLSRSGTAGNYSYSLLFGTDAQIEGTITDDDSTSTKVIDTFIASDKQIKSVVLSGTKYTVTYQDNSTEEFTKSGDTTVTVKGSSEGDLPQTELNVSDGSWKYKPRGTGDGSKKVYFYIKDNTGEEFLTSSSSSLKQPYFHYKTEADGTGDQVSGRSVPLSYMSDATSPTVTSIKVRYNSQDKFTNIRDDSHTDGYLEAALGQSVILGGTKARYVQFVISAKDENGISELSVKLESETSGNGLLTIKTTDASSGTFTPNTNNTENIWITKTVDFGLITNTDWKTDTINVTVDAKDSSGLKGNANSLFKLDKTKPELSVKTPAAGKEVTGSVTVTGTSSDNGELLKTWFIIPLVSDQSSTDDSVIAKWTGWKDNFVSADYRDWTITFSESTDTAGKERSLTKYTKEAPSGKVYHSALVNGVYTLPIWFKVEDSVGNYSIIKTNTIKYNPDADKPVITFTSPTESNYQGTDDFVVLGGNIRVTGSSEIPSLTDTIGEVYLQIDMDNDGDFDSADLAAVKALTKKGSTDKVYTNILEGTAAAFEDKIKAGLTNAEKAEWWGIPCDVVGSSWGINLNAFSELDPASGTKDIKIRACGVNMEGKKVGAWSQEVISIHVDANAPTGTVSLHQFKKNDADATISNVDSATSISSQDYSAGMFLKGPWWIVAEVLDESGIYGKDASDTDEKNIVKVYRDTAMLTEGTDWKKVPASGTKNGVAVTGFKIYIKVNEDAGATYKIIANDKDSTPKTFTGAYAIAVDNTSPQIGELRNGDDEITTAADFDVTDSNYVFTLEGSVEEEHNGSGFEKAMFFFTRSTSGTVTTLFDPVFGQKTDEAKAKNEIAVTGLYTISETVNRAGSAVAGTTATLYGKQYTGATSGTSGAINKFTATDTLDADHIRGGSIVKIDGLYRTVLTVSGREIIFTPAATEAKSSVKADFVYAHVVDKAKENVKSSADNPFIFKTGADQDGIQESLNTVTGDWTATLHSANMSDGPAVLHVFAFDKAGNIGYKSYNVKLKNNAPRIAKVYLGSDNDGNNRFASGDFSEYTWYAEKGFTDKFVLDTASKDANGKSFKIKNSLAVIPEIMGGSGNITMVVKKETALTKTDSDYDHESISATASGTDGTETYSEIKNTATYTVVHPNVVTTIDPASPNISQEKDRSHVFHSYVVPKTDLTGSTYNLSDTTGTKRQALSFSFWDSTPGGSQSAVLFVNDFIIDLVDEEKPAVVVHKFFWKNSSSNSLYNNSTANGHIELEGDLTEDLKNSPYSTGLVPKVSGKVVFRGVAYDDVCLKGIDFAFTEQTFAKISGQDYHAEYKKNSENNMEWVTSTKTIADGYEVEIYTEEDFEDMAEVSKTDPNYAKYQKHLRAIDSFKEEAKYTKNGSTYYDYSRVAYFGQKGHKVAWEISIDTEKVDTGKSVAKLAKELTVIATDSSSNSSNDRTTTEDAGDGTMHRPTYKVDVVPYITYVHTKLSDMKNVTDKSIYNRSSKGNYVVSCEANMDSITLEGFNLGTSTTVIATSLEKGKYTHTVNQVPSINNINDNEATGDSGEEISSTSRDYELLKTYAYNRRPNNSNNNMLTDDVVFDVWQINTAAATNYETTSAIREPVVKVNPTNGVLGFAFGNGSSRFSMPDSDSNNGGNTYKLWQFNYATYVNIALTYDEDGIAHGISTGIDTYVEGNNEKGGRMSYFNSKWGPSETNKVAGNFTGNNAIRFDCIGIPRKFSGYGSGICSDIKTGDDPQLEEYRFYSPSLAVTTNNNRTTAYLAYFDIITQQIRFRAGDITGNSFNSDTNTSFGQFKHESNGEPVFVNYNYSVIAGRGANKKDLTDAGYINPGIYLCIDVIPGSTHDKDIVVAVWQDSQNDKLMFAYNTNPYNQVGKNWNGNNASYDWTGPYELDSDGGKYCQIKVDASSGIHIASVNNADEICYTYIPVTGDTDNKVIGWANRKTTVVDAHETGCKYVSLDVSTIDSKVIPNISYFATKNKPKVAYLPDGVSSSTTSDALKGADVNGFTGNWDVSFVPTTSKICPEEQRNRTSVVAWRNNATTANFYGKGNNTTGTGITGNNTTNPIVGYASTPNGSSGRIEIAQKK